MIDDSLAGRGAIKSRFIRSAHGEIAKSDLRAAIAHQARIRPVQGGASDGAAKAGAPGVRSRISARRLVIRRMPKR